ncbi:MAG: hypothetical protein JST47_11080 [Bacteroidetes bacterium]|nr:hypothetical protein [Bacteroidota bacterium]MBS1973610.1 hypothetical protein [Bacteroidota bacterium]
MMKQLFLSAISLCLFVSVSSAQFKRADIYSDFVLYPKRTSLEKDLNDRLVKKTFSLPLDSNTEYRYASACDAITQFLFANADVQKGFSKLFPYYDSLEYFSKRSFLQAVYAIYPLRYKKDILHIMEKETDPRLFAICAVYLFHCDPSISNGNALKIRMVEKFSGYDSIPVLEDLEKYLSYLYFFAQKMPPDIPQLFSYQKKTGKKVIYSFQRYNRNYPGMAIVQNADGSFVKKADGSLAVFPQLARSGSNLPYFIKDGNTPQGIYSIQGVNVSRINFIGPTPNLQMIMPFESKWEKFFQGDWDASKDSLMMYKQLLPASWRKYEPMLEAWDAGKGGRTEIIAHGTTIDPEYYKGKPFYPLTPSQGCLTGKELWNVTTGRLLVSEQLNLVNAFLATPGNKGYLYVINLGDEQKPVGREEVEALVRKSLFSK